MGIQGAGGRVSCFDHSSGDEACRAGERQETVRAARAPPQSQLDGGPPGLAGLIQAPHNLPSCPAPALPSPCLCSCWLSRVSQWMCWPGSPFILSPHPCGTWVPSWGLGADLLEGSLAAQRGSQGTERKGLARGPTPSAASSRALLLPTRSQPPPFPTLPRRVAGPTVAFAAPGEVPPTRLADVPGNAVRHRRSGLTGYQDLHRSEPPPRGVLPSPGGTDRLCVVVASLSEPVCAPTGQ